MIKARMRAGSAWNDALILNMSSRGMLVRSNRSPGRGSYLELRRGPHVIVARVIWSDSDRFGVQTQDPVPTAALIRNPDDVSSVVKPAGNQFQERRMPTRSSEARYESSRHRGRAVEFTAMALAFGLVAILIFSIVGEVMAMPVRAVQSALAAH